MSRPLERRDALTMTDAKKIFARNLAYIMQEYSLSDKDISAQFWISDTGDENCYGTKTSILAGKSLPGNASAITIADFLGVKMWELFHKDISTVLNERK